MAFVPVKLDDGVCVGGASDDLLLGSENEESRRHRTQLLDCGLVYVDGNVCEAATPHKWNQLTFTSLAMTDADLLKMKSLGSAGCSDSITSIHFKIRLSHSFSGVDNSKPGSGGFLSSPTARSKRQIWVFGLQLMRNLQDVTISVIEAPGECHIARVCSPPDMWGHGETAVMWLLKVLSALGHKLNTMTIEGLTLKRQQSGEEQPAPELVFRFHKYRLPEIAKSGLRLQGDFSCLSTIKRYYPGWDIFHDPNDDWGDDIVKLDICPSLCAPFLQANPAEPFIDLQSNTLRYLTVTPDAEDLQADSARMPVRLNAAVLAELISQHKQSLVSVEMSSAQVEAGSEGPYWSDVFDSLYECSSVANLRLINLRYAWRDWTGRQSYMPTEEQEAVLKEKFKEYFEEHGAVLQQDTRLVTKRSPEPTIYSLREEDIQSLGSMVLCALSALGRTKVYMPDNDNVAILQGQFAHLACATADALGDYHLETTGRPVDSPLLRTQADPNDDVVGKSFLEAFLAGTRGRAY